MTRLVVVDTNLVVAALLTAQRDSPTARMLNAMLDGTLTHVLSPDLLATIAAHAIWREPLAAAAPTTVEVPIPTAPDDGDAHLWALLACEPTACLVTGEQLLLQHPYPDRLLMQPGQLWNVLDRHPGAA